MKKAALTMLIISTLAFNIQAQIATLEILDAETHESIPGVVAHSRLEKNLDNHLKTDDYGTVKIHIAKDDTISLEMKGYYPVHIVVTEHQAYEFAHPLRVYMTPLMHHTHHTSITDFDDMNSYDFHFTHHEYEDKQLKVQILEHSNATNKRNKWLQTTRDRHGTDFKIVVIKLPEINKSKN